MNPKNIIVSILILERAREFRHPPTPAERGCGSACDRRLGKFKFRRQHPIGRFIVDFYCAHYHLIIEVDGPSHWTQNKTEYDEARTSG
jgi:very-short-patch-repair endonuclease